MYKLGVVTQRHQSSQMRGTEELLGARTHYISEYRTGNIIRTPKCLDLLLLVSCGPFSPNVKANRPGPESLDFHSITPAFLLATRSVGEGKHTAYLCPKEAGFQMVRCPAGHVESNTKLLLQRALKERLYQQHSPSKKSQTLPMGVTSRNIVPGSSSDKRTLSNHARSKGV